MQKKLISLPILILILFSSLDAQSNNAENVERLKKGGEIIKNAHKAIGIEEKVNSFYFKIRNVLVSKTDSANTNSETITEISATLPDKIKSIWEVDQPLSSKQTKIWNAEKYKSFMEMEMFGNRILKNTTNSTSNSPLSNGSLKSLEGKISKERLEFLKNARNSKRPDPKLAFYESICTDLFPVIPVNPFEPNLEFKYVGKAEAG